MDIQYGNRRKFLKYASQIVLASASTGLLAGQQTQKPIYRHSDSDYDFLLARIKFDCDKRVEGDWKMYPGGEMNLLERFKRKVNCRVKLSRARGTNPLYGKDHLFNGVVDLHEFQQMKRFPVLLMTAEGYFVLNETQKNNFKRYILQGGFVLMDDCVFNRKDYFYQSSYKMLEELFGPSSVKTIPLDHEIFHNVFDLSKIGLPFLQGRYHDACGIFVNNRLAVFLSSTDLHCGWTDHTRKWFGDRGGPRRNNKGKHCHEDAIEMGINILMYAISH